jgi:hypothetical protein
MTAFLVIFTLLAFIVIVLSALFTVVAVISNYLSSDQDFNSDLLLDGEGLNVTKERNSNRKG